MPRGFADLKALVDAFRCDVKQLAACFQKLKATINEYPVVQRMAMSIVALHVVATIVDYYITKCCKTNGAIAKPYYTIRSRYETLGGKRGTRESNALRSWRIYRTR